MSKFQPENLADAQRFGQMLVASGFAVGVQNAEQAALLIVIGSELGLSAMQSIRSIHVIKGKPCMSADIMVGLVKSSPVCEYFMLCESSAQIATYETKREGDPKATTLTFSADDARLAGLLGSATWKKYPAAMLRARCSSALARAVYPDIVAGIYDPDEMEQPEAKAEIGALKWHHSDVRGLGSKAGAQLHRMGINDAAGAHDALASGLHVEGLNAPNRARALDHLREVLGITEPVADAAALVAPLSSPPAAYLPSPTATPAHPADPTPLGPIDIGEQDDAYVAEVTSLITGSILMAGLEKEPEIKQAKHGLKVALDAIVSDGADATQTKRSLYRAAVALGAARETLSGLTIEMAARAWEIVEPVPSSVSAGG